MTLLNPNVPVPPGFNDTKPTIDCCPECGGELLLLFRGRVIGEHSVLRGDLDSFYRIDLVSFETAAGNEKLAARFDHTDDWQIECAACGDLVYENFT